MFQMESTQSSEPPPPYSPENKPPPCYTSQTRVEPERKPAAEGSQTAPERGNSLVFLQQPSGRSTPVARRRDSLDVPLVNVNSCPVCVEGTLSEHFTCVGICLAILLFPIGLLYCALYAKTRCDRCGFTRSQ